MRCNLLLLPLISLLLARPVRCRCCIFQNAERLGIDSRFVECCLLAQSRNCCVIVCYRQRTSISVCFPDIPVHSCWLYSASPGLKPRRCRVFVQLPRI